MSRLTIGAVLSLAVVSSAMGQAAVEWRVKDGGNGHWYGISAAPSGWHAARAACELVGATLACTETASEAEFIRSAVITVKSFVFVGLYQDFDAPDYAEPAGGWRWVSGEPVDASLWQPGEPNNFFGDERFGELEGNGSPAYLNDVIPDGYIHYYIEWSADCNNDGIIDYGQCHDGTLLDANANNIPDCCEGDTDLDDDGTPNCNDPCPTDPLDACANLTTGGALEAWGAGRIVGSDFPDYGQSIIPSSLRSAAALAGGWMHSLALKEDGTVAAWGSNINNFAQATNQSIVPASLGVCTAISAGFYHSLVLRLDGTVAVWGDNQHGQSTVPANLGACQKIAGGGYHSAVIRLDGTVACWGAGILFGGSTPHWGQCIVPPSLGSCTQITAGGYHTGVVRTDGTVACWGDNTYGQCTIPVGLGACIGLSAGDTHTAALRTDGTVVCWGGGTAASGLFPQFGQSMVPSNLGACTSIAAGGYHTVALRADGSVAAFGAGSVPSTALADQDQSIIPSLLALPYGATKIAAGGLHTLAVTTQRRVPSHYATIQEAIDACDPHDSVIAAAGNYAGPINFLGKNITVRGAGAATTTIAGTGGASVSVVRLMTQEPEGTLLEGFTIRGGLTGSPVPGNKSAFAGGGIFLFQSHATVANCIIEQNGAAFGAGVYMLYCGGSLENCVIRNNAGDAYGGGALLFDCTTEVVGCTFTGNSTVTAGGGMHIVQITTSNTAPQLSDCTFTGNSTSFEGGGLSWYSGLADLEIVRCQFTGNIAPEGGGAIVIGQTGPAIHTLLIETDACGNTLPNILGSYLTDAASVVCDCAGDTDGNGIVNGPDLAVILAAWGTNGTDYPGSDANHDGIVSAFDLAATLSNWGVCD